MTSFKTEFPVSSNLLEVLIWREIHLIFFLGGGGFAEAQPTPDIYQGEVMDMLKEFTKNREQEQRLDAPSLEYLDKEIQWSHVEVFRDLVAVENLQTAESTNI